MLTAMTDAPPPTWQRRALYTWIAATAIYYYANFSIAFYRANESAIASLLDQLF